MDIRPEDISSIIPERTALKDFTDRFIKYLAEEGEEKWRLAAQREVKRREDEGKEDEGKV